MEKINKIVLGLFVASSFLLSGCSNDLSEIKNTVATIKASTPEDIEPIPEIKIYEKYTYQSGLLRSPFQPDESVDSDERTAKGNGPRPNPDRNKEFLEEFPLDTLSMVGTLTSNNVEYALILTNDGLIHQVKKGNYMGQNEGEVLGVTEFGVQVRELVPDGLGGYAYRPNELPLKEDT